MKKLTFRFLFCSILFISCYPKANLNHYADGDNGLLFPLLSTLQDSLSIKPQETQPELLIQGIPSVMNEGQVQLIQIGFTKSISKDAVVIISADSSLVSMNQQTNQIELNFTPENSTKQQAIPIQIQTDTNAVSETVNLSISAEGYTGKQYSISIVDTTVPKPKLKVTYNGVEYLSNQTFDFGRLAFGTTKTMNFTIENLGEGTLKLTNPSLQDDKKTNQFSVTAISNQILPGNKLEFSLQFTTGHYESGSAVYKFQSNDSKQPIFILNAKGEMYNGFILADSTSVIQENYPDGILLEDGNKLVVIEDSYNQVLKYGIYVPAIDQFFDKGGICTIFYNCFRESYTLTLLNNGNVLLIGYNSSSGTIWGGDDTLKGVLYDSIAGEFILTNGSMSTKRKNHTATLLQDGKVLICGGTDGTTVYSSCELYDPDTDSFSTTDSMNHARERHNAILLSDGKVVVIGGMNSTALSSIEIYDPVSEIFQQQGNMNNGRIKPGVALLNNGKYLITGGYTTTNVLNTAEIYDPTTDTSTVVGNLYESKSGHTSTLLSNGKVLLQGVGNTEIFIPE